MHVCSPHNVHFPIHPHIKIHHCNDQPLRSSIWMVDAMLSLYKSALGSRHIAKWFHLLSDSTAPLKTCEAIHAELEAKPHISLVQARKCTPRSCNCAPHRPRTWPLSAPFLKASQWSTVWRDDAVILLRERHNKTGRLLATAGTPDEHYIPNILRSANVEFAPEDVTMISQMTCSGHPETINCDNASQVDQFRRFLSVARFRRKLFARKLAPSCVAYLEASKGMLSEDYHGVVSHVTNRLNAGNALAQAKLRGSTALVGEVQPAMEQRIRPLVVLLVFSTPTEDGRRRREAQLRSWPQAVRSPDLIRLFFVLGGVVTREEEGLHTGASDVEELHLAVPEKYTHLSLKMLRALQWLYMSQHALAPAFVAKTDDDTYVCIGTLLNHLVHATLANFSHDSDPWGSPLYMGRFATKNQVYAHKSAWKWNDPGHVRTFGMKMFPKYAVGAFYALSSRAVYGLLHTAKTLELLKNLNPDHTTFPANEDALVGTLLHLHRSNMSNRFNLIYLDLPILTNPDLMFGPASNRSMDSVQAQLVRECASMCRPENKIVAVHRLSVHGLANCPNHAGKCALSLPEESVLWLRLWLQNKL